MKYLQPPLPPLPPQPPPPLPQSVDKATIKCEIKEEKYEYVNGKIKIETISVAATEQPVPQPPQPAQMTLPIQQFYQMPMHQHPLLAPQHSPSHKIASPCQPSSSQLQMAQSRQRMLLYYQQQPNVQGTQPFQTIASPPAMIEQQPSQFQTVYFVSQSPPQYPLLSQTSLFQSLPYSPQNHVSPAPLSLPGQQQSPPSLAVPSSYQISPQSFKTLPCQSQPPVLQGLSPSQKSTLCQPPPPPPSGPLPFSACPPLQTSGLSYQPPPPPPKGPSRLAECPPLQTSGLTYQPPPPPPARPSPLPGCSSLQASRLSYQPTSQPPSGHESLQPQASWRLRQPLPPQYEDLSSFQRHQTSEKSRHPNQKPTLPLKGYSSPQERPSPHTAKLPRPPISTHSAKIWWQPGLPADITLQRPISRGPPREIKLLPPLHISPTEAPLFQQSLPHGAATEALKSRPPLPRESPTETHKVWPPLPHSPPPEIKPKTEVEVDLYESARSNSSSTAEKNAIDPPIESNDANIANDNKPIVKKTTTSTEIRNGDQQKPLTEIKKYDENVMCRNYIRGNCNRDSCLYAHKIIFDQLPGVYTFCHDYQNNICTRAACKFIHATIFEKELFYRTGVLVIENEVERQRSGKLSIRNAPNEYVGQTGEPPLSERQFSEEKVGQRGEPSTSERQPVRENFCQTEEIPLTERPSVTEQSCQTEEMLPPERLPASPFIIFSAGVYSLSERLPASPFTIWRTRRSSLLEQPSAREHTGRTGRRLPVEFKFCFRRSNKRSAGSAGNVHQDGPQSDGVYSNKRRREK